MCEVTERPEVIELGVAKLVGISTETIVRGTQRLFRRWHDYKRMALGINPYGEGQAAKRIVQVLGDRLSAD